MSETESQDTALSASSRFLVELAAWIAGPWAAAQVMGSWWWAVPTLLILVAFPATFNTPGDKNVTGIPISGTLRIALELALLLIALVGAVVVWPPLAVAGLVALGITMLVSSRARYRWLVDVA